MAFELSGANKHRPDFGKGDHVMLTVSEPGRVFMRRAVRWGAKQGSTDWLVGELHGVRVYIKEHGDKVHILMTAEDINP